MPLIPNNREHGWAPYVWLIFLAFFLFQPVLDPHTTRQDWIITISAIVVFLVIYFRIFWVGRPWNLILIACIAAMGIVLAPRNVGSSVFIIFAASFLAWAVESTKLALVGIGLLVASMGLDAVFFHTPIWFWGTGTVVSLGVGFSNIHFAERNRADRKLR